MADEIKVTLNVTVTNGTFKDSIRPGQISIDQATASGGNPGTVTIGTSEENISFGDVTPGYVYIQNLDATNFVEFGKDDASTMKECIKVLAGEIAFFRLADSETLRAKADTANVNCLIKGYAT